MHVVPFAPLSYHESANCILCSPEPPQEFQEKNWGTKEEDGEDAVMFEEDWDDTEINDDFTNQLRKELAKKQDIHRIVLIAIPQKLQQPFRTSYIE